MQGIAAFDPACVKYSRVAAIEVSATVTVLRGGDAEPEQGLGLPWLPQALRRAQRLKPLSAWRRTRFSNDSLERAKGCARRALCAADSARGAAARQRLPSQRRGGV